MADTAAKPLPPPPNELHGFFGSPSLQPNGHLDAAESVASEHAMTVRGTVGKALVLFLVSLGAAYVTWSAHDTGSNVHFVGIAALFVGLLVGLNIGARWELGRWLAVPYAACQGTMLGALTSAADEFAPGVARSTAVGTTLVCVLVFVVSLTIPRALSHRFITGVGIATGAVLGVYVVGLAAEAFGAPIALLPESGWIAVALSLLVIVVACANLLLDLDFIRSQAARRAPATMEWFAAWSLLVTIVWVYLEVLRILFLLGDGDGDD